MRQKHCWQKFRRRRYRICLWNRPPSSLWFSWMEQDTDDDEGRERKKEKWLTDYIHIYRRRKRKNGEKGKMESEFWEKWPENTTGCAIGLGLFFFFSFFFNLCLSCNVPFCSSSSSLTCAFVTPTALLATHLSLPTMEILF